MSLRVTLWFLCTAVMLGAAGRPSVGAGFSASYRELSSSPANHETTWYSGAVTRDGKFIYGLGHSHNSYGDNSLWLYDPATNTHKNLQPSTGDKWVWDKDASNQTIPESGRWSDPTIRVLTNRNNHQAFYLPARNEFWVLAGTTFYQSSPYFAGRFSLDTNRWAYLSPPWGQKTVSDLADFSAGLIAGTPGWVAPNAATAVCADINTVVLFGGMNGADGVRIIEPNPGLPEPYRWASAPKPPFHQPAENVRHNAACAGDTVYFVEGQRRIPNVKCCMSPDPAQFWKFHVPSRAWTRLPDGPAGAYFTVMTYDSDADALLVYGGSGGPEPTNRLWVYDLRAAQWHNLTGTVPNLPRADMHTGGFIPGFGHIYKGGRRFTDAYAATEGYGASRKMMVINLTRAGGAAPPAAPAQPAQAQPGSTPASPPFEAPGRRQTIAQRVAERRLAAAPAAAASTNAVHATPPAEKAAVAPAAPPIAPPARTRVLANPPADSPRAQAPKTAAALPISGGKIAWTKIDLPGKPISPQGTIKHQRLAEGPDGRVYTLGGDWGGDWGENTGRQEVYSFDPLHPTGDWRLEAPYCGTVEHPVHWHTDEAGVAWDAKRKVFWKLAGTEYGPGSKDPSQDPCLAAGRSVKAKVITFDPATKLWAVPPHVAQTRFGYVANGVLDPDKDQMVQIIDKQARHLDLTTGQWSTYPLPAGPLRFNAITARLGRDVYWCNRNQVLESYNLDTHTLTTHSVAPWPVPASGWEMQMVMTYGDKVLVVRPTSRPDTPRHAALYDPATRQWTKIDQGDGWGNGGMMHSSGKLILMGGGIDGPPYHNKHVWVGEMP